jgi:hypothetical protein
MRVTRGDADDARAGAHEHLHRRDECGRRPVGDEDIVRLRHAAEVVESQLVQTVGVEGRRELVVEHHRLLREHERALEAREVEDLALGDDPPRRPELGEVILGGCEDLTGYVGHQTRRRSRYAARRVSGNEIRKKTTAIAP